MRSPALLGALEGILSEADNAQIPNRTAQIKAARPASPSPKPTVDLKSKEIAATPVEDADQFDFSTFVRKLNTLRAGRSMKKHPELREKLDKYFTDLDEGERASLVTFLDAIGKIITADATPEQVPDPSDPPASVKMSRAKAEEIVREAIRKHLEKRAVRS